MTDDAKIQNFVAILEDYLGRDAGVEKRSTIDAFRKETGFRVPTEVWNNKHSRGHYDLSALKNGNNVQSQPHPTMNYEEGRQTNNPQTTGTTNKMEFVPEKDPNFVKCGVYPSIKKIIKSNLFVPSLVVGLNGNGKTESVIQACAETKRKAIRVNFTIETDEDDLLGGYRLENGDTVWKDGPVIQAMKLGAVLILDEIDRAHVGKVIALQSILEGNGHFIKKTGEYVSPQDGFTIIATANTKGRGSEDGRFAAANILDEAMLDRFSVAFEQPYPTPKTENKILTNALQSILEKSGKEWTQDDTDFVHYVTKWVETIRKTFDDGGVEDVISTRRAVDLMKAYAINDRRRKKAIEWVVSRFEDESKESFISLFDKLDANSSFEEDKEDDEEEEG